MTQRRLLIGSFVALVAASAALVVQDRRESAAREHRARKLEHGAPNSAPDSNVTRPPSPAPQTASTPAPSPAPLRVSAERRHADEATIMSELRALAQSAPERSLALVREADARFPGSEDAPERSWFKIRSLVNLGRWEEAQREAVVMVDTFRDTPWAADVERHLLTHPLNHPSQRGNSPD